LKFSVRLGIATTLLKDEALNPTGSFKARGMATAMTMARGWRGHGPLPSAGNAGSAAAAYGALAGLAVDCSSPDDTPEPFRLEAIAHGAHVHLVRRRHRGVRKRQCARADGAIVVVRYVDDARAVPRARERRRWATRSPSSSGGPFPT
jgi:threonine dehydratase